MAGHPTPFVNAFDHPALNSLRYNTSQWGSPIPIVWGTQRITVNVLGLYNFQSKGSGSGKGGGATKGKSGGKTYTINVQFGLCQGPVNILPTNLVWSNAGVQYAGSVPLNFYGGFDGQPPDPTFASTSPNVPVIGYSGTCYATGTPLQMGNSPVLPNVSAEITGFFQGTAGSNSLVSPDASPALILQDALTNPRYGAGYPASGPGALDPGDLGLYANYCTGNLIGFSLVMDRQQPMSSWVEELAQLSVSAVFFSSGRLRIVPYSSTNAFNSDTTYAPDLTPKYQLGDDDYLTQGGTRRAVGDPDPVIITRTDVSQLVNWMTLEILDRNNWYDPAIQLPLFDQGSIDTPGVGIKSQASVQAHEICNPTVAYNVASLMLKRKLYLRNTYKFRLGWRYMLLEPMDIVGLTDTVSGLFQHPVRITEIQEDENGILSMTAEDLV